MIIRSNLLCLSLLASLPFWIASGADTAVATPAPAPSVAATPALPPVDPALAIPATDEGLPGEGPIRRGDWFQRLWNERRTEWASRVQEDQGALVFLGDSITQGWGNDFRGAFPAETLANRGISGDTTRGLLIRLKGDVLALHPKGVVLLIGTNDLEEQAEPKVIAGNVRLLLDTLTQSNPRMPIVFCQVFPSSEAKRRPVQKIKALNALYAELVKAYPQVTLLDTWSLFANAEGDATLDEFPDLLHPNEKGYARWVKALRPVLVARGLISG